MLWKRSIHPSSTAAAKRDRQPLSDVGPHLHGSKGANLLQFKMKLFYQTILLRLLLFFNKLQHLILLGLGLTLTLSILGADFKLWFDAIFNKKR